VNSQASGLNELTGEAGRKPRFPSRLRCLAIGSGKGGVGKTMVSVGVACSLAKMQIKTLLVDADLGLANVDLQMGINPKFTMQDVVFGNCPIEEAITSYQGGPDVLPASSGATEMVEMGNARRSLLVSELVSYATRYDFLVIDVGAGIGNQVTAFLAAAPEVAIVVANEPTSIMDAYSLIKVLSRTQNPPAMSIIVNSVSSFNQGEQLASKLNGVTERFLGVNLPVLGIILRDEAVGDAIRARTPVPVFAEKSAAAQCIAGIAKRVAFETPSLAVIRDGAAFFESLAGLAAPASDGGGEA